MNANQLTQKSIEAIQSAQNLAGEKRNTQLEQAHLLYALIDDPNDLNAQLFEKIGVNLHCGYVPNACHRQIQRAGDRCCSKRKHIDIAFQGFDLLFVTLSAPRIAYL